MRADVLSVWHTCPLPSPSHQTAGVGNPCPSLQHRMRLKGWTDGESGSHARQILPHSLQQQQKPSGRAGKLKRTSTVWSEKTRHKCFGADRFAQRHLSGGRQTSKLCFYFHLTQICLARSFEIQMGLKIIFFHVWLVIQESIRKSSF